MRLAVSLVTRGISCTTRIATSALDSLVALIFRKMTGSWTVKATIAQALKFFNSRPPPSIEPSFPSFDLDEMSSRYDIVVATAARDRKFVTIYGNFSTTLVDVRIELRAVNITIALSDVAAASLRSSSFLFGRATGAFRVMLRKRCTIRCKAGRYSGAHKRNFDSCLRALLAYVRSQ